MLNVLFESLWLWYLTGVALWAFVGALAAAASRLPVGAGAAAGGLFWFVGTAVVLILGLTRRAGRPDQALPGSFATTLPPLRPVDPFAPGVADPFAAAPANPFAASPTTSAPWSAPAPAARDPWGWPAPDAPAIQTAASDVTSSADTRRWLVLGLAMIGGAAMLVSAFLPWGSGAVAWDRNHGHVGGGLAPISVGTVAVSILVSAGLVLACGSLMHRRPSCAWPAVAAIVTTWWFCLVLEWLLLESSATSATERLDGVSGDAASASLSTASGVWVMLFGCAAVYAWCAAVAAPLFRRCSAAGRRAERSSQRPSRHSGTEPRSEWQDT